MTVERPIEIQFLPTRLREEFTGRLAESTRGTTEERKRNFLTRALAAFAVHKLSGCCSLGSTSRAD